MNGGPFWNLINNEAMRLKDSTRLEIHPGMVADGRRALWFDSERALVLSDLHLGYCWSHREQGQLMPLVGDDALVASVEALLNEYRPLRTIFLGDIVHATVHVEAVRTHLGRLIDQVQLFGELVLVAGNHDQRLAANLDSMGRAQPLLDHVTVGRWRLHHGHLPPESLPADSPDTVSAQVIGHEHPACELPEGPGKNRRLPCFLVGPRLVVLPAFSPWASGVPLNRSTWLSSWARTAAFEHALVCFGSRLLRFPFKTLTQDPAD